MAVPSIITAHVSSCSRRSATIVARAISAVGSLRAAGKPVGQSYWADSALIAELLIPTVLFGPGGDGAHAQVEWVSVADVERCVVVLLSVATEFCA